MFLGPNALSLGCLKNLSGQVRAQPVIGYFKTCKSLAPLARIFELTKLSVTAASSLPLLPRYSAERTIFVTIL